jgi:PAS domain S-box-containing protein
MTKKHRIAWAAASWSVAIMLTAAGMQALHQRELARERLAESIVGSALDDLRDSTNHGFAVLDEHGAVVEWNTALERWTGYPEAEVLGKPLCDFMPPSRVEGCLSMARPTLQKNVVVVTTELVRKDGTLFDISAALRVVPAIGDKPQRMILFVDPQAWVVRPEEAAD